MLTYTDLAILLCLPVYAKETALQGHLQMQGGWGVRNLFANHALSGFRHLDQKNGFGSFC
jgi:hypothetical protein